MKLFAFSLLLILSFLFAMGCASRPDALNENVIIKHDADIKILREHVASISKENTFPFIVEPLRQSMHNPDRFEFIRAESLLREKSSKRSSGVHITYYYLIRIHFRGENVFGALRKSHQDYHLYPTGKIHPIQKKK